MHARRWSTVPSISALLFAIALAAPAPAQEKQDDREKPGARRAGRAATPRAKLSAAARGGADQAAPGREAPDFALPMLEDSKPPEGIALDADGNLRLSSLKGKKPVVLIFGSYT